MIESLEARRLMTVDVTLTGLTSTLPVSVESASIAKLKTTAKFNLLNSGTEALPKTAPSFGVNVYLTKGGVETLVGSVKPTKFAGLKVNGTKPLSAKLTLPSNLTLGTYTLIARVDPTNVLAESNESNNVITGAATSVAASGTALFANYGFADSMTFHKTNSHAENGAFDEGGTFTDANGVTGGYIYTVSPPIIGRFQVSLTLFRTGGGFNQTYIMTYLAKGKKTTSIDGHTAHFAGKPNGGIKVTGGNTASGNSIYYKLA